MDMKHGQKTYRLSDDYSLFKGDFREKRFQLFNIASGGIFTLNEPAYDMLALFDGRRTTEEVFKNLKEMYQVEDSRLQADLTELLDEWVDKKVLV